MTFHSQTTFLKFRRRTTLSARCLCAAVVVAFVLCDGVLLRAAEAAHPNHERVYRNQLIPISNPPPFLADFPEFVEPIRENVRYEAPVLIEDENATLSVRAWRFSYNARGIVEMPNRLLGTKTAIIVVHPWGIDDGQGWKQPEPAGVALFCTPEKNRIYRQHVRKVVNPFVERLRDKVALVMYSLPGSEDPVRKKLYRSFRQRPDEATRAAGRAELAHVLKDFDYTGGPLPATLTLSGERPETIDYFRQFSGLDSGANFNGEGFWKLPIPVVADLQTELDDVVIYDADGYPPLRDFMKQQGIRHVLLCGYATEMCVCSTTAGYENLMKDFNVFLVGDATLATFPSSPTPAFATNAALSFAALKLLISQVSWVQPMDGKKLADRE